MRILVVDDDDIICQGIRKVLKPHGHEIMTANNAIESREILAQNPFDLVILDFLLPGTSGLGLARELSRERPDLILVLISGFSTVSTTVSGINSGVFDYLPKPFKNQDLLNLVQRVEYRRQASFDHIDRPCKEYLFFGEHSWVRFNRKRGSAIAGLDPRIVCTIDGLAGAEPASVGFNLEQGGYFLNIFNTTGNRFSVWSPVTGSIVRWNPAIRYDSDRILNDPLAENAWFVEVDNVDYSENIKNLRAFQDSPIRVIPSR